MQGFPHLLGVVRTFEGGQAEHRGLLDALDAGGDWGSKLSRTGLALCPAVCHPLYATLTGTLPPGGRRFDLCGYAFRHEPSSDPARLQAFRMHEYVFVGEEPGANAHRELWHARGAELLSSLGLEVTVDVANDPFFGRAGTALAALQLEEGLKHEILAPTSGATALTALASTNRHRDHFATVFEIMASDGAPAHSTCCGFGLERIALALVWRYGTSPRTWPDRVRTLLGR